MNYQEARDKDGRTRLHQAALDDNAGLASELIAQGAVVNTQDKRGYTPLHLAAQAYALAAAEILLSAGATVDAQDRHGNTPLWIAVFNSLGRGELIHLLRAAGANPLQRNRHERSPLDLARSIANYDVAQFFADVG